MRLPLALPDGAGAEEIIQAYDLALGQEPDNQALLAEYAEIMLNNLCVGGSVYAEYERVRTAPEFRRLRELVERLPPDRPLTLISCAVISLLNERNELVLPYLKRAMTARTEPLECGGFVFDYFLPLKAGFPGMWDSVGRLMEELGTDKVEDGLPELCRALERYYRGKENEAVVDALAGVAAQFPRLYLTHELLGDVYCGMKLWKNALACYERVADKLDRDEYALLHISWPEDLWFDMAWCCGKVKRLKDEETYYRKALEWNPAVPFAQNNLAYCLYKQGRYEEAAEAYRICIANGKDLSYAVNGLARALLVQGRLEEAGQLLEERGRYLSKELKRRIREGRGYRAAPRPEPEREEAPEQVRRERAVPSYQFTSERILEDELIGRMDRGQQVFGLPLSVYERKGVYGRQFVLPDGRIDILAEDQAGSLYAIELKRDSGYDDPYVQTVRYVEWLESHMAKPGQKVYGIICLSEPKPDLVQRVRQDERIRLFEYRISYGELL